MRMHYRVSKEGWHVRYRGWEEALDDDTTDGLLVLRDSTQDDVIVARDPRVFALKRPVSWDPHRLDASQGIMIQYCMFTQYSS